MKTNGRDKFNPQMSGLSESYIINRLASLQEDDGLDRDGAETVAALEQLGRIADALESIDNSMDLLTGCIGYVPPKCYGPDGRFRSGDYYFLRIGGDVGVDQ